MRQAILSHNKTNSDYANCSSHILIFLWILKKTSEHEFVLSYTDHLPFFSSGLEYRLALPETSFDTESLILNESIKNLMRVLFTF